MTTIEVGGPAGYRVRIGGPEVLEELAGLLSGAATVAVVTSPAVRPVAERVAAAVPGAALLVVPDGEPAKRVEVLAGLWDELARLGLTRSDAVVAVGGGAVTDLAGFAAASFLRGIRVVHVPTTLLGMVDAAVGGKTGIDLAAGKNLVGAFHPPAGVLCDLGVLDTLPAAELTSGLAEVAKVGFIADPVVLDLLEEDPRRHLPELVARSVAVKAEVVTGDLREAGRREFLNYGHTLGHAIERHTGYTWRHGEAVSVGLCFAAALGHLSGRLGEEVAARHRELLAGLGLPTGYPGDAWPDLVAAMRLDKKSRGAVLRFVVLDGLAEPGILAGPDPDLLTAAYLEVSR